MMNDKQRALQLKQSGLSYMEIAKTLGIGKTTAYQYVKEAKQEGSKESRQGLPAEDTHTVLDIGATSRAINSQGADEDISNAMVAPMNRMKQDRSLASLPKDSPKHKSIFGRGLDDEQVQNLKELALLNQGVPSRSSIAEVVKPHIGVEKENEKR